MLLAHSADPKRNIPAQSYADHINGVARIAAQAAKGAAEYSTKDGALLKAAVSVAAEFHDLGKLDSENQPVLTGEHKAKKLPVQHADAGTAHLVNNLAAIQAAVLVSSHHKGLPSFPDETNRAEKALRDDFVFERVNKTLPELLALHQHNIQSSRYATNNENNTGDAQLFFRIALSCLADGDHSDTAIHYQEQLSCNPDIPLRPLERLNVLDNYVNTLQTDDARSKLRTQVYQVCRNSTIEENIVSCDSPVGTGKTTAIMAHLLAQANKRGLRRIIIVLPFTNIISQSVEVYRKSLVLPGEIPEMVVAELHHRADFQDIHSRQFTALWKAPIIVTTAVSFFETLASNNPSTLRRLHNLPGSAVFIDEAHAALPAKLLPLAWRWIKGFAEEWRCYWVLASGSLNRFWKIEEFDEQKPDIPVLLPQNLSQSLANYEQNRVHYKFNERSFGPVELAEWIHTLQGPRLVIVNTVQSAAVLALNYERIFGRHTVEHISTALSPADRKKTIDNVKKRLENHEDRDWTLIATSCVEAGVDFSFNTGVREAASLVSLLQTAGRVNRHGVNKNATIWTILLKEDGLFKKHSGFKDSAEVLMEIIESKVDINPELCTDALKREIRKKGSFEFSCKILHSEGVMNFPKVEEEFKVISSDTRLAVIDQEIIDKIELYQKVDWREIQNSSVQIWGYRLEALRIPQFKHSPELYKWNLMYDDFIGYMKGILQVEEFKSCDSFIF